MKDLYYLIFLLFTVSVSSQTYSSIDETTYTNGYMNVFENNNGAKGDYLFGSVWGITAIIANVSTDGSNTVELKPNTNGYAENANDSYWRNNEGAGPDGNKWMEASSYTEISAGDYSGGKLTFSVDVTANDLDSRYSLVMFIKDLAPDYSTEASDELTISGTGVNTLEYTPRSDDNHVQYGFRDGLNANPATDWGSVTVTAITQSSKKVLIDDFKIYPNPVSNRVSVSAAESIDNMRIYDLSGRLVKQASPHKAAFSVDVSGLSKGVYLVKLNAGDREATTKMIK
ncbi:MAG: T9SS type A sorting domain-containing protein [Flavobacteriaceae bacterium]|nr:T9SS type A sorting domain-containing protein [Flavobacteriaceae bacterium]